MNGLGELLETAVVYALKKDSIEEFESSMIQLRAFYNESKGVLPPSSDKYGLLGLYLLFLIYKNRTADYYTELELLSIDELKNPCIAVAVVLEQHFVDGNYHKILHTQQSIPVPIYHYFINKMIDTVRHEAARSAEKAYKSLRVEDAYKIFLLDNPKDLETFIDKERAKGLENKVAWILREGCIHFEAIEKEKATIPARRVIDQSFLFAHELEKIV